MHQALKLQFDETCRKMNEAKICQATKLYKTFQSKYTFMAIFSKYCNFIWKPFGQLLFIFLQLDQSSIQSHDIKQPMNSHFATLNNNIMISQNRLLYLCNFLWCCLKLVKCLVQKNVEILSRKSFSKSCLTCDFYTEDNKCIITAVFIHFHHLSFH